VAVVVVVVLVVGGPRRRVRRQRRGYPFSRSVAEEETLLFIVSRRR